MMQWLDHIKVVPSDTRLQTWLALGFLAVCLINTVGLMLAKFMRRAGELGVRRALGASQRALFGQLLMESGVIGIAGGLGGLLLALLGLWLVRQQPRTTPSWRIWISRCCRRRSCLLWVRVCWRGCCRPCVPAESLQRCS